MRNKLATPFRSTRYGAILLGAVLSIGFLSAGAAEAVKPAKPAKPSNAWRIECSGNAESAGTVVFRVVPKVGEPIVVTTTVVKGRSENGVARDIRDAFKVQLPKERFKAETDDGEDVLVKKKGREPNFVVEFVSSDVKDFRLDLERE